MHIVIRKFYTATPETVIAKAQDEFLPLVSKLSGFVGYQVVDAGDGVIISIGTFDSEFAATASTAASEKWIVEHPNTVLLSKMDAYSGKVVVSSQD